MSETEQLRVSCPKFLSMLDDAPAQAFEEFYRFAKLVFKYSPPGPAKRLPPESREDLFHEFVYYCVRADFRVLRQYRDQGRPFAGWVYVVAHRVAIEFQERTRKRPATATRQLPQLESEGRDLYWLIARVTLCLSTLGDRCRVLLALAADEYQPREIADVLGLPETDNKRIADQIRECRRQLRVRLEEQGIKLKEWL